MVLLWLKAAPVLLAGCPEPLDAPTVRQRGVGVRFPSERVWLRNVGAMQVGDRSWR
jgi:hypothetical protein